MSNFDRDPDDLARRLRDQLASDAEAMDLPPGDVDTVVARGRRTRAVSVAGAIALVVVVGVGAWAGAARLLDPPPSVVIDRPADPSPISTPTPTPTSGPSPTPSPTPSPAPTTPAPTPTPTSDGPSDRPTGPVVVPESPPAPAPDPTPTPTPQPEPTPTPTPTPPADPEPTGDGSPLVAGPLLVAATDDGIVAWSGGEDTRVPGIDGPVDQAFDDGRGGVVFQRNDRGIGRLVDGRIETLVALSEFGERSFDDGPGTPELPERLELHDVDPVAGRLVVSVHYLEDPSSRRGDGTDATPSAHAVDVSTDLDGAGRRELRTRFTWEEGADLSLAGNRILSRAEFHPGAGELVLLDGGDTAALGWDATFPGDGADVGQTESLRGAQLGRDGRDVAFIRVVRQDGLALEVRDVVTGGVRTELDVTDRATFLTRVDFDGRTVLLSGESDEVDVLDLATGEWTTTTIPGLRSVTTGLASADVDDAGQPPAAELP